ncbi:PTS sugar transporter subunit IIA [Virgibacillus salarius]|uniref:BglG family transcription antiterminator n=1 Tax=Virgibacillus salarius TaxID=447199 RepID=UPI002491A204|nr:PTS sugar transporter subunit IIA [Virgibacillus salarius]WBX81488.1 PTS sugar transporter subunit IIA [Virgibacillus salarius]
MRKDKKELLIEYLQEKNDWVQTKELTELLNISPRTLRNYISLFNHPSSDVHIESSHLGYRFVGFRKNDMPHEKKSEASRSVIQTPSQRMYYMLQQLVLLPEGIDLFEISDYLHISMPTVERDMQSCRSFLKNFDLQLCRKKDQLSLSGLERNKRKLMSAIYFKEYNTTFYNIIDLEEVYDYDLHAFRDRLLQILNNHGLDINEYTIGNIIYHIVISIERIKDEQYIQKFSYEFEQPLIPAEVLTEVKHLIEDYFHVFISNAEMNYLQSLLASKTTINLKDERSTNLFNSFINEKYIHLVQKIIEKVNDSYLVDLADEEFQAKFALHIKNMAVRAASGFSSKNPLTQTIKTSSPLIYDLAVFISNIITEEEHVKLPEDEITYIALHVGSCLELKQHTMTKIQAILITPGYYDIHKDIQKKIRKHVGNQITFKQVITQMDYQLSMNADMIITTMPTTASGNTPTLTISPFVSDYDLIKIRDEIERLKAAKARARMKQQLLSLFDERLFVRGKSFANETETINYLGKKMIDHGLVPKNYLGDVLKGEKMSSTAFNQIVAVPHSMKMDALQTTIAILIPKQPIHWGESDNVRIVSLIAMSQKERKIYREIYDEYIKVLTNPANVSQLATSTNFQEFIDQLSILMGNDA